jgi:hypothetical protein
MKKYIVIPLLSILFVSCNAPTKEEREREFYTDKGSFDMGRIPLIKPFEVVTTEHSNWILQATDDTTGYFTVDGVKEVRVVNQFILVHSLNTTLNGARAKEGWFVIIPKTHFSKGFATHQEYLDLLHYEGFSEEPALYKINTVFEYFDKHDTITWGSVSK